MCYSANDRNVASCRMNLQWQLFDGEYGEANSRSVSEADTQSESNIDYLADALIKMRVIGRFATRLLVAR